MYMRTKYESRETGSQ